MAAFYAAQASGLDYYILYIISVVRAVDHVTGAERTCPLYLIRLEKTALMVPVYQKMTGAPRLWWGGCIVLCFISNNQSSIRASC